MVSRQLSALVCSNDVLWPGIGRPPSGTDGADGVESGGRAGVEVGGFGVGAELGAGDVPVAGVVPVAGGVGTVEPVGAGVGVPVAVPVTDILPIIAPPQPQLLIGVHVP